MRPNGNSVSPTAFEEAEMSDCEYSVTDFLPTNENWLDFLKCLVDDNVEDLRTFSKHVNWKQFLRSRDLGGSFQNCSPEFTGTVAMSNNKHPFPSNPFFVALFYNARKCLLFMNESGVDFSSISEFGFNAYHNLMGAISFISRRHFDRDTLDSDIKELVSLFHDNLFDRKQHAHMVQKRCCTGMMPMSWGVFLGLADYVERILYYHAPNCVLKSEAVGIAEHITLDVSEFVGENPSYFTSPLCVLLDLYGEASLPELKRLGIFRHGFIWKQWVDLMFISNRPFIYVNLVIALLLTVLTVAVTGPQVNDHLKLKCAGGDSEFPSKTTVVQALWLLFNTLSLCFVIFGLIRKEFHRFKCNYPRRPRLYYQDLRTWFLPNIVLLVLSSFLLWLYVDAGRGCQLFGSYVYIISGLCNIILLLACVCIIVCYLRLLAPLTTLMSSFYNSLMAFTTFIFFYLVLTGVFARMFQSSFIFSSASNSSVSRPDTFPVFLSVFYKTFLVSLNIVDSTIFIPQDDRIDLNVTHIFFILFVPILFINFVVGLLSSVVSQVLEHDIENRYILMLQTVDFSERTLAPLRKLFKPRSIVIRLCEPLCPKSRLISFNRSSIARPISQL